MVRSKKEIVSYIAGLFDGEGSIYIRKATINKNRSHYSLVVRLTNSHKGSLDFCCNYFNAGSVQQRKPVVGRLQAYDWILRSKEAENVLKILLPYSIIKAPQILLALEFRKTIIPNRGRYGFLTEDEQLKRQNIQMLIRNYNKGIL